MFVGALRRQHWRRRRKRIRVGLEETTRRTPNPLRSVERNIRIITVMDFELFDFVLQDYTVVGSCVGGGAGFRCPLLVFAHLFRCAFGRIVQVQILRFAQEIMLVPLVHQQLFVCVSTVRRRCDIVQDGGGPSIYCCVDVCNCIRHILVVWVLAAVAAAELVGSGMVVRMDVRSASVELLERPEIDVAI